MMRRLKLNFYRAEDEMFIMKKKQWRVRRRISLRMMMNDDLGNADGNLNNDDDLNNEDDHSDKDYFLDHDHDHGYDDHEDDSLNDDNDDDS